jgi:hypothetical protein
VVVVVVVVVVVEVVCFTDPGGRRGSQRKNQEEGRLRRKSWLATMLNIWPVLGAFGHQRQSVHVVPNQCEQLP